eukprot:TRINITY_DN13320_c0_g1_i1.p1 TRINITY_DN13320_c0_g1~~TRINITY_DN13320_c0_g1_i1.p1  ORF type:complete len:352 (+),score=85.18 TRINITY_DN13320_c0_g1_i1:131-1186(+)
MPAEAAVASAPAASSGTAHGPEWQGDYFKARPVASRLEQESLRRPEKSVGPAVLRVAQLDADLLNRETTGQLRQQFRKIFAHMPSSYRYDLELDALLSLLIFRFSVWGHNQGYGDRLQNVVYRSERTATALGRTREVLFSGSVAPSRFEKLLLCVFSIVLPYAFQKLVRVSIDEDWGAASTRTAAGRWKRRLHAYLQPLENYFHIVSLVNLLVFLFEGKYRSLTDRVLQLRLVNFKSKVQKVWSFEFMDRQLGWKHFSEFLTFAWPFINFLPAMKRLVRAARGDLHGLSLPDTCCPICNTDPIQVGARAPCGHHFCYYCVQSAIDAGSGSTNCPRCGHGITSVTRPTPAQE